MSPSSAPTPFPAPANSLLTIQQFAGPLPPPQVLQDNERLLPGAAERLTRLAEQEAAHHRDIEARLIRIGARNETLSIITATLIVCGAFAWAGYALFQGQSAKGSAVVICTIGTLASLFLYGKRQTSRQRVARQQVTQERLRTQP